MLKGKYKSLVLSVILMLFSIGFISCYHPYVAKLSSSSKSIMERNKRYYIYDKDSAMILSLNVELFHEVSTNHSSITIYWRVFKRPKNDTVSFEVSNALAVSSDAFQFMPDKINIRQFDDHFSMIYSAKDKNNPNTHVRLAADSSYKYVVHFPFQTQKLALDQYKAMLDKTAFKIKVGNIYRNGKKLEFPEEYLFYCEHESLKDNE